MLPVEVARALERVHDHRIGAPDVETPEPLRRGVVEGPVLEHRTVDLEPHAETGLVVLLTVAGSGVDHPGTVFEGDVIRNHDRRGAVDEGVAVTHARLGELGTVWGLKVLGVLVVLVVVYITKGQRRIPVQYAKLTRGRKVYGGQRINAGGIIIRQRGTQVHPGVNVGCGKDHTLYATASGHVRFETKGPKNRKFVSVDPA